MPKHNERKKIYLIGMICLFNAGWIDSIVLYDVLNESVTYMTGNFTTLGRSLAEGAWAPFTEVFILIGGFLFGSIINGVLLKTETFSSNNKYTLSLLTQSLLMALGLCLIGYKLQITQNHLIFLAIAMGMQNSLTTVYLGAIVRTTHLTGTLTDLGIQIGRMLSGKSHEKWKILFFIAGICSFVLGAFSCVMYIYIFSDHYTLLLFPSIILPMFLAYQLRKTSKSSEQVKKHSKTRH